MQVPTTFSLFLFLSFTPFLYSYTATGACPLGLHMESQPCLTVSRTGFVCGGPKVSLGRTCQSSVAAIWNDRVLLVHCTWAWTVIAMNDGLCSVSQKTCFDTFALLSFVSCFLYFSRVLSRERCCPAFQLVLPQSISCLSFLL